MKQIDRCCYLRGLHPVPGRDVLDWIRWAPWSWGGASLTRCSNLIVFTVGLCYGVCVVIFLAMLIFLAIRSRRVQSMPGWDIFDEHRSRLD